MNKSKDAITNLILHRHISLGLKKPSINRLKSLKKSELEEQLEQLDVLLQKKQVQQRQELAIDKTIKNSDTDAIHISIGAVIWLVAAIRLDVAWYLYDGDFLAWLIAGACVIYQFFIFPFMAYSIVQKHVCRGKIGEGL